MSFFTGTEDGDETVFAVRYEPKGGTPSVEWFELQDCSGADAVEARGGGLSVEATCVTGRCTVWGHSVFRTTVTVKDGKLDRKDKEVGFIAKAVCD